MKKSLLKDAFRQIFKYPGRFISIFTIVAIGSAFFAGIKTAAPNMKYTADQYYDAYNMMDIRLLSTMGFVEEDLEAVKEIDGVKEVAPSYFQDVTATVGSLELVFRIHSIPNNAKDREFINMPKIVEGRLPEKLGECIIESSQNMDLGLEIGDKIQVSSGKKEDLSDKLASSEFTIVGKAASPYYLTFDKDSSDIGSGKVNFFMMTVEDEFLYPVFLELLVTVDGVKELNSYSSLYEKKIEVVRNQIENMGSDRAVLRLESIRAEAMKQLEEGRKKLAEEEENYNKQIADGEIALAAARDDIVEGEATLETEKKNYAVRVADAEARIRDGERQLADAKAEYNAGRTAYNNAVNEYGDDLAQLDSASQSLKGVQNDAAAQRESIAASLSAATTPEEYESLSSQLASLDDLYMAAGEGINTITGLNDYAQSQMQSAETQLNSARVKLNAAETELQAGKNELAREKRTAEAEFLAAEATLSDGKIQYDEAKKEFDIKKAEGEKALQDGREKIIRAENEIERLQKPSWYVLDRMKLYSYADYAATADRMDAVASLFPVFFFAVAALVCLTTMTRMVDEQRASIGVYKALGYSNNAIAFKYVNYAAIASIFGGILGAIIGIQVFPKIIFNSWSMMYNLPPMLETRQTLLIFLTVLAGFLVTTMTAYVVTRSTLKEVPAMLMRPKMTYFGKMILLERMTSIWSRFSFSQKVTMRNIFRYKKRFIMTVTGIAGCAALLVAGFGLSNSISKVVVKQYQEIFTYNLNMKFEPTSTTLDRRNVRETLEEDEAVESYIQVAQLNATVKGDEDIAVTMISPYDPEAFGKFIRLRERASGDAISLPETGIVINEKLAKELGVSKGDSISVDNGDGAMKKLLISGITENYVFHYIYIHPVYYEEIFRLKPDDNALFIRLYEDSREAESALGTTLIDREEVASVAYYRDAAEKFEDSVVSLNAVVFAIIICAALLAFVVLYNLTNINLSERLREIATIKVLGFYNREVSAYVYRENMILTLIGGIFGLIVGIFLHRAIMGSIEQDGVMFGNYISGRSFIYSFFITLIFGILVNLFMYRKLTNIKMVESLKSVE
ncbi:FtsX-like permease family protein [Proteiniclasticum sp.]|uniref:FtsX-like permease family protein n=1 Tax=Proteiniclasticum sp. TaxID=2053595 RepID=UPI00289D9622|nr:FtsX-like permease family protein [Proteiniclasticum sp.]